MFLTTSICLHFLYLSFLSDASLLMPLSFSWMMASSMGSAEPGLPVKATKASQTVCQGKATWGMAKLFCYLLIIKMTIHIQ